MDTVPTNEGPQTPALCPVCQDIPIMPRMLGPCGHVLCTLCCVDLVRHQEGFDVHCPVCRAEVTETHFSSSAEAISRRALGDAAYATRICGTGERLVEAALHTEPQVHRRIPDAVIERQQAALNVQHAEALAQWERCASKLRCIALLEILLPAIALFCAFTVVCMAMAYAPMGYTACVLAVAGIYAHAMEHRLPKMKQAIPLGERPTRSVLDPLQYEEPLQRGNRHHHQLSHARPVASRHVQRRQQQLVSIRDTLRTTPVSLSDDEVELGH
jgi:hypothetical protein